MRRYGILIVIAFVLALAALRSLPGSQVQAAPLAGVSSETSTATATATPTATATTTSTPTGTPTTTATPTITQTPTKTQTPTVTPTIGLIFPLVFKQPSLTPTQTSTRTPTWTPSKTPTSLNCNGRFDGSIALEENKPTYATYIEWVKFIQWVHNNNGATTCFGILGFKAFKPDGQPYPFNSQWSASGVSSKYLTIYANCWGPNGQPCAGSQASGQQEDHMGSGNYIIADVGPYSVEYWVCYSNYNDCQNQNAHPNWQKLGVISFQAINWTPGAPSGTEVPTSPAPTGTECYLVTDDPAGIYLNCNFLHLKERQLFHH